MQAELGDIFSDWAAFDGALRQNFADVDGALRANAAAAEATAREALTNAEADIRKNLVNADGAIRSNLEKIDGDIRNNLTQIDSDIRKQIEANPALLALLVPGLGPELLKNIAGGAEHIAKSVSDAVNRLAGKDPNETGKNDLQKFAEKPLDVSLGLNKKLLETFVGDPLKSIGKLTGLVPEKVDKLAKMQEALDQLQGQEQAEETYADYGYTEEPYQEESILEQSEIAGQAPIPPREETGMVEYIVVKGDTLGKIEQSFYGKNSGGKILWPANTDRIKSGNPDLIQPGERLRIPKVNNEPETQPMTNDVTKPNTILVSEKEEGLPTWVYFVGAGAGVGLAYMFWPKGKRKRRR